MGCLSCGKKKKGRYSRDVPLLDEKGNIILRKAPSVASTRPMSHKSSPATKGAVVKSDRLQNVQMLPRTKDRTKITTFYTKGKAVYVIGYFAGCSACSYMLRSVDRAITPDMLKTIKFYAIEKNDVNPTGFTFSGNPTIVFLDQGKPVHQVSGTVMNIGSLINSFYQGMPLVDEPKAVRTQERKHVIYKLKPDPTHIKAYEKLLKKIKNDRRPFKNVSTFLDPVENILVVTIDYE